MSQQNLSIIDSNLICDCFSKRMLGYPATHLPKMTSIFLTEVTSRLRRPRNEYFRGPRPEFFRGPRHEAYTEPPFLIN